MSQTSATRYATSQGYMTGQIQRQYIESAIAGKLLPANAHRMAHIISLKASGDLSKPIQFWQLYSVLGQDRIVKIVRRFYEKVFDDEAWFSSVFAKVGGLNHHVSTQASMWIDVMGGGHAYHGGEYRLRFHHTHNAMQLMNDKGAQRWVQLMAETLNEPSIDMTDDPRVRPALNTFLTYFMGKYADEFAFENCSAFGETNPPVRQRFNFLNMSEAAIKALSEEELTEELLARGVDDAQFMTKDELVSRALRF